uniref:Uncharacterized protein n=1 Tax=Rangifer tarandus platyrhynchus TaxID=3082113 RepID=A0ACB0F5U6_RANTA|nr:unnamed protein product [Rangifer tarandus platyrhynchus]
MLTAPKPWETRLTAPTRPPRISLDPNRGCVFALLNSLGVSSSGRLLEHHKTPRKRKVATLQGTLLRGPQSPAVKGPPARHAPYVPQDPPEDLDSPLQLSSPWGRVNPMYSVHHSAQRLECAVLGTDLRSGQLAVPALLLDGPGSQPPPAHLGVRRWPWARLGPNSVSMGFQLWTTPQGDGTRSQVCKRQRHPRMRTSQEHLKEQNSVEHLRHWAKCCSEKSERPHAVEPEEVSFPGGLGLGQGLGVQL